MQVFDKNLIKKAVEILKDGGVIVYPTDTAYGLGCDFLNKKAIEKIYKIKGRAETKQLPTIASSLMAVRKFCKFSKKELELARKYWPKSANHESGIINQELGKLTLVLRVKKEYRKKLGKTLAVRVPNSDIARALAHGLRGLIVSTSANLSGQKTCYDVEEVIKQFKNKKDKPDLILDAGKLAKTKTSTIVQVVGGEIKVLRRGAVEIS